MPYREADVEDPMELVGVQLAAGPEAVVDMAYAFAEEYAKMGYDEKRILGVFSNPKYHAAHDAYRQIGAPAIEEITRECLDVYGRFRLVVHEAERLVTLRHRPGGEKEG